MRIGFACDDLIEQAHALAQRYGFTVDNTALPRLQVTANELQLLMPGFSPLSIDFSSAALARRRAAGKQQGLVRACKPAKGLRIVDMTAGWGRDAAILASLGAEVFMVERQPVMAALLEDALARSPIQSSLTLLHQDAKTYLQTLSSHEYPDVIYIDPMHPVRQKSALVKKDMQALQQLFGPDLDALELINLAISRAKRVVVKWPQREKPLIKPAQSIEGKTVRFDIY